MVKELEVKKLALVLTTSTLLFIAKEKVVENAWVAKDGKNLGTTFVTSDNSKNLRTNFIQVLYIQYSISLWIKSVLVLFDSNNEVNNIYLIFTKELRLLIKPIGVRTQEIDGITLDTYRIVVATFLLTNKANQEKFFKEKFLVANVSLKVVFKIFFLTLNSINIDFLHWKLRWGNYTT